jgi:hypothetical protein
MSSVALSAMTCEVLKQMCRERGLKVSGKKEELVSRLVEIDAPPAAACAESAEEDSADSEEFGDASAMKAKLQAMPLADLMKIAKAAMAELERRAKSGAPKAAKAGGAAAAPKKNSVAEWQQFVLTYSLENGWPSFEYKANRKLNGVMTPVVIEMPASELEDGAYIVPGSVSKKSPAGVQLSISQAMCLAKKYWSSKENAGEREDLWQAFQATQPQEKIVAVSPSRPKMTLAALQQQQLAAEAAAKALAEAAKAKNAAAKPSPKAKPLVKKAMAAAVPKWSCPNDGMMHEFSHGGVQYRRNFDGYIFGMDEEATYLGKWNEAKSCLDDTVPSPFE